MNPLRITPYQQESAFRLGGNSPIINTELTSSLQYFLSLPYQDGKLISVFISSEFDNVWEGQGQVFSNGPAGAILLHENLGIREDNINSSSLPLHSFEALPSEEDFEDEEEIFVHHKIGGFSLLEVPGVLEEDVLTKLSGLDFYAQVAFPDHEDSPVDGTWPIMECTLCIYRNPSTNQFCMLYSKW